MEENVQQYFKLEILNVLTVQDSRLRRVSRA